MIPFFSCEFNDAIIEISKSASGIEWLAGEEEKLVDVMYGQMMDLEDGPDKEIEDV